MGFVAGKADDKGVFVCELLLAGGSGGYGIEGLPSRNGLLQIGHVSVGFRDFLGMRSSSEITFWSAFQSYKTPQRFESVFELDTKRA